METLQGFLGIEDRAPLHAQGEADAAKLTHAAHDREHLVARTKEAWAVMQGDKGSDDRTSLLAVLAGPGADECGDAVITNQDDPNFDIEKFVAHGLRPCRCSLLFEYSIFSLHVSRNNPSLPETKSMHRGYFSFSRSLRTSPLVHMNDGLYFDGTIRRQLLVDLFRHVGLPVTSTGRFLVVQLAISSRRYSKNEDTRLTNASLLSIHRTQHTAYQPPYQATCRNGRCTRMRQVAR
jgi:hypothetical protein